MGRRDEAALNKTLETERAQHKKQLEVQNDLHKTDWEKASAALRDLRAKLDTTQQLLKAEVETNSHLSTRINERAREHQDAMAEANRAKEAALKDCQETHARFAELKERIAHQVNVIAHLRGYIARVHEDDVVGEDLVRVGDPEGEQQMVPKRKHAALPEDFVPPPHYKGPMAGATIRSGDRLSLDLEEVPRRNRPRSWVNY